MSIKNKKKSFLTENDYTDQRSQHFVLRRITPLTPTQEDVFRSYERGQHLMLHGSSGSGKTYVSLYLALRDVLSGTSQFKKVIIIRSVVPSRDMGFLPGSIKEKTRVYEEPYREICDDLFGFGSGYETLKARKLIEFTSTSFLRGLTFQDSIVLVDEFQNNSFQEVNTVMTRVGDNSRIIFCGDYRQTDLKEKSGLRHFMNITKMIPNFAHIEFTQDDIVRSGLVKDYIVASEKYMDKYPDITL